MKTALGAVSATCAMVLLLAAGRVLAEDSGSAKDAKAMLERAVAAVKADEAKALAEFSHGGGGFRDRDLYVFCARSDGKVDAHIDPAQIGRNIKDLYDVDGVAFGQEMMAVAQEGDIKGGQLHVAEAGLARAGAESIVRDQGGRPSLRSRLLQVKPAMTDHHGETPKTPHQRPEQLRSCRHCSLLSKSDDAAWSMVCA